MLYLHTSSWFLASVNRQPLQVIREKKMMKQDLGDILGMMFGGECHSRVHGMARAWHGAWRGMGHAMTWMHRMAWGMT